ncbi:hypothetical protein A1Q1_00341 [Trichosporon asahii var. asahii CBS 2479]|uniref:Uncharacterized protein n=1 Tax=Trichosporon asahii var. asahii (strain ATCC 90039 / CBS 2479 / JCM 2466 / KCTC 7840 / NBRC 103889/ NCYC 2677 / UAMH 7654) TaxID=1186058 RepID=J6F0E5_TRIAS|nr:hypothetical protein A1Q1_00341 [Trichosporon asahii var. asahii CBS 2479]EJT50409.1 hypothetical protein A1Q1_00341 [Trichosporon asahii var. asahii CBS 2479]
MIGGGAANDFLEPTEVPTGPRPLPADMTPPRARVAQWRQTTTDAVDPRDLPRWNHDAPADAGRVDEDGGPYATTDGEGTLEAP